MWHWSLALWSSFYSEQESNYFLKRLLVLPRGAPLFISMCRWCGFFFFQAFFLVRLINFHKKMSIWPLGWGVVKTYGFALNQKNRIAALQVLVREYHLQFTAIQHLSAAQLGEIIFRKDCWKDMQLVYLPSYS